MTTFLRPPGLVRGALVTTNSLNPVPNVIVFAPVETARLDVEIDATDQMEKAEGNLVGWRCSSVQLTRCAAKVIRGR